MTAPLSSNPGGYHEWPIPRCQLGCGLARHKNSCEAAGQALAEAKAMIQLAGKAKNGTAEKAKETT